jgi:hypothetical protein
MEAQMTRDLLVMSGAILALGLVMWTFWGNPEMSSAPNVRTVQSFDTGDPDLRLVSERSPYMRTER